MVYNDSKIFRLNGRDFLKKNRQVLLAICSCLIIGTFVVSCAPKVPSIRPVPTYIINTGTPTEFGWWLVEPQWLASKFTINGPGYFITDIEGYFNPTGSADIIIDITDSAGDTPGSITYYSNTFFIDHKQGANWYGIHGITNLKLSPNDYWVILRPAEEIDQIIEMPKNPPASNTNYAVNVEIDRDNRKWRKSEVLNIGIRVSGNPLR